MSLLLGLELVSHPVARLDEGVLRCATVDLLAQLADEDVDGAVAMPLAPAPELLEQLVPADNSAALEGEGVKNAELGRRQVGVLARDVGLHLARVDAQLLDLECLPLLGPLRARATPRSGLHPRDELLHRERLHEVVVRADVEGMDAVVLGAASADDDDRRPDPLGPGLLDQPPPVDAREHQVDDADVGTLEPQTGEPGLSVLD